MPRQYKYEANNANGTLKRIFPSQKEAEDFAQEKLYDYPTYTITPVEGSREKEDKPAEKAEEDNGKEG